MFDAGKSGEFTTVLLNFETYTQILPIWVGDRIPRKLHYLQLDRGNMEAETNSIESFRALALQVTCHAVNQATNRQEARSIVQQSIQRLELMRLNALCGKKHFRSKRNQFSFLGGLKLDKNAIPV